MPFNQFGNPWGIGFNAGAFGRGSKKAKIYGVSWDKSSNPTLTRTNNAVGMVANAGVDAQVVVNNFDTAEIYKDIKEVTDTYGNVFIRIPAFYIKKTDSPWTRQISKKPFNGSYLPWCFWDFVNSKALPYIDIGKYKASLSGDGKLESKTGKYPLINKNIVEFRTYAKNNNANEKKGYQQLDVHAMDVINTLMYIEFATLNTQLIMQGFTTGQITTSHTAVIAETNVNRIILANANASGYVAGQHIGISSSAWNTSIAYGRQIVAINMYDASNKEIVFDGTPVNVAIGNILHNIGWKSGFSAGITAKSGSIGSNNNGKYPCVYRGIESPFGDLWQWVDGLNINEGQSWVAKNADDYASNLFANPYLQVGYTNAGAEGYVKEMGYDVNLPFAEIPTVVTGASSSTYYSDYHYRATGQRVARVGGVWNYGSFAGPAYLSLLNSSSDVYVSIGGRLLKKPLL